MRVSSFEPTCVSQRISQPLIESALVLPITLHSVWEVVAVCVAAACASDHTAQCLGSCGGLCCCRLCFRSHCTESGKLWRFVLLPLVLPITLHSVWEVVAVCVAAACASDHTAQSLGSCGGLCCCRLCFRSHCTVSGKLWRFVLLPLVLPITLHRVWEVVAVCVAAACASDHTAQCLGSCGGLCCCRLCFRSHCTESGKLWRFVLLPLVLPITLHSVWEVVAVCVAAACASDHTAQCLGSCGGLCCCRLCFRSHCTVSGKLWRFVLLPLVLPITLHRVREVVAVCVAAACASDHTAQCLGSCGGLCCCRLCCRSHCTESGKLWRFVLLPLVLPITLHSVWEVVAVCVAAACASDHTAQCLGSCGGLCCCRLCFRSHCIESGKLWRFVLLPLVLPITLHSVWEVVAVCVAAACASDHTAQSLGSCGDLCCCRLCFRSHCTESGKLWRFVLLPLLLPMFLLLLVLVLLLPLILLLLLLPLPPIVSTAAVAVVVVGVDIVAAAVADVADVGVVAVVVAAVAVQCCCCCWWWYLCCCCLLCCCCCFYTCRCWYCCCCCCCFCFSWWNVS